MLLAFVRFWAQKATGTFFRNWNFGSLGNGSQGEIRKCGVEPICLLRMCRSLCEMDLTLSGVSGLLGREKDNFALS